MAFTSNNSNKSDSPMAEINMVPLIDVMLVLLIIFMVTAPLLNHAVKMELPKVNSQELRTEADPIQISILADGTVNWNGEELSEIQIKQKMSELGQTNINSEIHFYIEKKAIYESLARILSMAAQEGLTKIAFVTEPVNQP